MQVKKQQLELDMDQWTVPKLGKECVNAVYCHPAYLTYMQSVCLFTQSCLTLWPHELEPGSSVHGIHQARILEWVAISFSKGSFLPGDQTHVSCIGRQILCHWAGVGSLSLLQGVFPTQGLNPGLPHCRWILYHRSHQGSPRILEWVAYPFPSPDLPNPGIKPGLLLCRLFLCQLSYQGSPLSHQGSLNKGINRQ